MSHDFLFELGCEELPSGSVWPLAHALTTHILQALDKAELTYKQVKTFATPRRLALLIGELQASTQKLPAPKRGPVLSAAYDKDGKPSQALLGFAKSCQVSLDALTTLETEKGSWVVYEGKTELIKTQDMLPSLLRQALDALPITKPMRWGAGEDSFARPVHWAVLLYANTVIPMQLLGVNSSQTSYGHRFHHPKSVLIKSPASYEAQMQEAFVIADFAARQDYIKKEVERLADSLQAEAILPQDLLDEITSIVEWPVALLAQFDKAFLEVPAESLIASLQTHQKCIALRDKQGQLLPYFITLSNIESKKPEQVVSGNEKVVRARLSDAAFFYTQDKKQPLSSHIKATERVIFQEKLGSLLDKTKRLHTLMQYLAPLMQIGQSEANRAVELSKCDLLTGMVGEFPELEGIMGYYYALHDGEDPKVALALKEQYLPRFAADYLPESSLGMALSLVDRIDTLVGIFAIGLKPSGVKDPFKLRRHALAIVRLLLNMPESVSLSDLINASFNAYKKESNLNAAVLPEIKAFILERLQSYYQGLGVANELILAARARQDDCLPDLAKRIQALQEFVNLPEAAALAATCKRASNLLQQVDKDKMLDVVEPSLLEAEAEKSLHKQIQRMTELVQGLYAAHDYTNLLKQLASLKEPLDTFFDQVMVMVDKEALKNNRLALLAELQTLMQGVADIALL